jgi:hypothetical protein
VKLALDKDAHYQKKIKAKTSKSINNPERKKVLLKVILNYINYQETL